MQKKELIKAIADQTNISAATVDDTLKMFVKVVSQSLKEGKTVKIPLLGTFSLKDAKARKAVLNGVSYNIPAGKRPHFKFSQKFKELFH